MMFLYNSKIIDKTFKCFIFVLFLIIFQPINAYAETYRHSLTINTYDTNENNNEILHKDNVYKHTLVENSEIQNTVPQPKETERVIILHDSPLYNPYIRNNYTKEVVYRVQTPKNKPMHIHKNKAYNYMGGYNYSGGYNYNGGYNFTGGFNYGSRIEENKPNLPQNLYPQNNSYIHNNHHRHHGAFPPHSHNDRHF